jgi:putative DNA primase/helicase
MTKLYENIPNEMKILKCWVGFKLKAQPNGKIKKVPKNPYTGGNAKSNNQDTWAEFEVAQNSVEVYGFDGIGFMFLKEYGFIGVDIDNCIETNAVNDLGVEAINMINSYTEKSISGNGIHIICRGKIPKSKRDDKLGLEVYDSDRYFVMTGDMINNNKIEYRSVELLSFYNKFFHNSNKSKKVDYNNNVNISQNNNCDMLNIAFNSKNGEKIKSLYEGDLSYHGGNHSSADMALANYLAFYTNGDPKKIDEIIRTSGLYREKWDQPHYSDGSTYGERIIQNAIGSCSASYNFYSQNNFVPQFPWYEINPRTGNIKINTGILTRHLIESNPAVNIMDNFLLYEGGCYKPASSNQRYSIIRKYIEDRFVTSSILKDVDFQWISSSDVQRESSKVNTNPYLINLKNGLYDVKNSRLLYHTSDYISTIQLNVEYKENEQCPTFIKFINESVNPDNIKLVQEILGYMLVPITAAQKSFILVGPSNTGKSTFLKIVKIILGENNISNVPLQSLSDRFKTAELHNKLANLCADLPAKPLEDTGYFKMLIGEDMIMAERKFGNPFSFYNVARLLFSCNSLPTTYDKSDAFFNRLIIIPFNNRINEINPFLIQEISQEKDGVFLWALEGLGRLIENKFKFSENTSNAEILNKYKVEQSNVKYFISERCIIDPDKSIGSQILYNSYKEFCLANNLKPLSSQKFSNEMTSQNTPITKTQVGQSRLRSFVGITLLTDKNRQFK